MARLFIPQIGNELKLTANWDCKVFNEYRNSKIFDGLNIDVSGEDRRNTNIDITFPKGTVLKVSRLYVRAPASSYDSITFNIVSCPIKALNKARFWVKLMDANKIEFEENVIGMDSYKKLKDLHRFVALKNNYQNSEKLLPKEAALVNKEIYEHFADKNNNVLTMKFDINAEEFAHTVTFEKTTGYHYVPREELNKIISDGINFIKSKLDKIEVIIHMIPVLDGWVIHFEENQQAIEIDKELGIYNKEESTYWGAYRLGSYISYNNYHHYLDKKEIPKLLAIKIEQDKLKEISFDYQGEKIYFKDQNALEKFLKSIRVKIPK
jgi:hypothetical protein